jgi:hypothetical protein
MKSFVYIFIVLVMGICIFTTSIKAEAAGSLEVTDAAVCEKVVDRAPVGANTSFSATVGKLYCFTKIIGAQTPTTVTHVWYFGETEKARIELKVGAASWRTKSSKKIRAHMIGAWHVDVLDADGNVLRTLQFYLDQ